MKEKDWVLSIMIIVIAVVVIGGGIFFGLTPTGRAIWNSYRHTMQETDDQTMYKTRKQVEDTCRAMIASYEADRLTWQQYKDSDNAEKQSWAEQAKMRANKTASSYNNYVLKNQYVWDGNIPSDINHQLDYLQ